MMRPQEINSINFDKLNGLVPAIVQHAVSSQVLMVGFMNREALARTLQEKKATFWSRSKQRLWQKGEGSGNVLDVSSVQLDCDNDAVLVKAIPRGPVCHSGSFTCFGENETDGAMAAFDRLEAIIAERKATPREGSYTAGLFKEGTGRIAQKVGEEAVETVIAALQDDAEGLKKEAADLVYHLMVLLKQKGMSLGDVAKELTGRMK